MIRTMMAELQLECFTAKGETAELVAKAYAEDRHTTRKLSNRFVSVDHGLGITGPVREENAVWLQRHNVFGGGVGGHDHHVAVMIHEQSKDILLNPVIVGDNLELLAIFRAGVGLAHLLGPR